MRLADGLSYPPLGNPIAETSVAIEEYETDLGPADYVLADHDDLLGVVEAKKLTLGPQGVLPQAERYAKAIPSAIAVARSVRRSVPVLHQRRGDLVPRRPSPSESFSAGRRLPHHQGAARDARARLREPSWRSSAAIPGHEMIRPYQVEANTAIEQAIEARHRKMMVTMATGTGKTLMTVNEIYRLMKSGVARRVLFLVDRRALAAQAVRAFASFEAEPGLKFDKIYPVYSQRFQQTDFDEDEKFDPNVMPNSLLTNPKLGDAFVYVSTIQRMSINLFGKEAGIHFGEGDSGDEDASKLDIPIHAFDLIVADECHRGYSSKELSVWRNTLDWFDAIKIGLTATPAAHTVAYFENMVYRYEYERAVREGYLVDYDVVRVNSDVRMNGVFLHEGEQVDQVDPEYRRPAARPSRRRASLRREPGGTQHHGTRLEPQDSRRDQALRRRTRGGDWALPEDPDLRGQRPAPHIARRPARRSGARRLRSRRSLRRQDHWSRRPAAAEDPRVPQSAESQGRGHGRPSRRRASTSPTSSSSSSFAR